MEYLIFISHSGEDTWVAKKMAADCESVHASTFLDETRIASVPNLKKIFCRHFELRMSCGTHDTLGL